MIQGTNLKAEPSNTVAPANPLCSPSALQSMQDFKVTGGNTIALVIPLVQDDAFADVVRARTDTPSDACLVTAMRSARGLGLNVVLKPLLEMKKGFPTTFGMSMWRYHIHPRNPDKWQASWNSWMLRYARIGQAEHAYMLIIGTEMGGVSVYLKTDDLGVEFDRDNPKRWINLVALLRRAAPALKLGYAANRTNEAIYHDPEFVRSLDAYGFTLYPKLRPEGALTVVGIKSALQKQYKRDFDKVHQLYGKKITVFEFGYRSRQTTHRDSADGTRGGVVDLREQQLLYEATYQFFNELPSYLNGVYTWLWETNADAGGPKLTDYTVQNKPAEATQAAWFGGSVPQRVEWIAPLVDTVLSGKKSFIRVRLADQAKWPAGTYTADFKFNSNRWYRMTLIKGEHPYPLATIYPSQLPRGTHLLSVRMRDTTGKLIAVASTTVRR